MNCQVVYVLGVEGSIHHGFMPIIRRLAEQQADPETGVPYHVVKGHEAFRAAIFGSEGTSRVPLDDPDLVRSTIDAMCPPADEPWRHHVVLEGNSFPSGGPHNEALPFRVRRQSEWRDMDPLDIASDANALEHPTNLVRLYDAFSPHVDVRFVALHRPYLETVASHVGFDFGAEGHSVVISGFLIILSRFLMGHLYDDQDGGKTQLWSLVCAEMLSASHYASESDASEGRRRVVERVAAFLGWPRRDCPGCFDEWRESGRSSPEDRLGGAEVVRVLNERKRALEGVWPPRRDEDGWSEQQCRM